MSGEYCIRRTSAFSLLYHPTLLIHTWLSLWNCRASTTDLTRHRVVGKGCRFSPSASLQFLCLGIHRTSVFGNSLHHLCLCIHRTLLFAFIAPTFKGEWTKQKTNTHRRKPKEHTVRVVVSRSVLLLHPSQIHMSRFLLSPFLSSRSLYLVRRSAQFVGTNSAVSLMFSHHRLFYSVAHTNRPVR